MQKKELFITKASGENVPFLADKLKQSLSRAGASQDMAKEIVEKLYPRLYQGVPTKKIYRWAFNLLRQKSNYLAARYKLKKAIMELGPSGYPFERFVAQVLKHQGYSVNVGEIVKGKCVNHEVDVVAQKNNECCMVECKYHNQTGIICDVKIPLYIQARFEDIKTTWQNEPGNHNKPLQGWVFTNTRFSDDAVQYGSCCGLKLTGWGYPKGKGLKEMIDDLELYPVTCLTSLTKKEKENLLNEGIVLCKDVFNNENALLKAGVGRERIKKVMDEENQLCSKWREKSIKTPIRETYHESR